MVSLILSAALAIGAIYPVNTHVGDGRGIVGIDKAYQQGSTVDRAGALELVKQDGRNLAKLDDGLKSDREIVLEGVKADGRALDHADEGFKSDREIVLTAIKENPYALFFANDSLKSDRDFMSEMLNNPLTKSALDASGLV